MSDELKPWTKTILPATGHNEEVICHIHCGKKFIARVRGDDNALSLVEEHNKSVRAAVKERGEDTTRLVHALNEIADDCEQVSRDETVTGGEKRAWLAVANKARRAAMQKQS